MKYTLHFVSLFLLMSFIKPITGDEILRKIDKNMSTESSISETEMIIHGRRNSRTIGSIAYARGRENNFTEYLSPDREKGTKMLKLEDRLWIYSPSTDRTIQLSGHMLRQSVMGSDLSYEDMMDDRKLYDIYSAEIEAEETLNEANCWKLLLTAKVDDATYETRRIWVDKDKFVPLQEELYAKSGELLKKTVLSDIQRIDNRWYPMKINYKDMLKNGEGTDFVVKSIEFEAAIPDHIFSKAALKK